MWARHRSVQVPIETDTLERAAAELDIADAAAEVYRSSPTVLSPESVWRSMVDVMPELLGKQ